MKKMSQYCPVFYTHLVLINLNTGFDLYQPRLNLAVKAVAESTKQENRTEKKTLKIISLNNVHKEEGRLLCGLLSDQGW